MPNCKCINDLKGKIKATDSNIKGVTYPREMLSGRAYIEVTLEMENGKKKKEKILLSRCPHCGVKYEDMKEAGAPAGQSAGMPGA